MKLLMLPRLSPLRSEKATLPPDATDKLLLNFVQLVFWAGKLEPNVAFALLDLFSTLRHIHDLGQCQVTVELKFVWLVNLDI